MFDYTDKIKESVDPETGHCTFSLGRFLKFRVSSTAYAKMKNPIPDIAPLINESAVQLMENKAEDCMDIDGVTFSTSEARNEMIELQAP